MKFYKICIIACVLMFLQTSIHSQCTDQSVGDLDAMNLSYSPSVIYTCSKVTVNAEWDVISNWAYDADLHLSKFIVSLPNEFVGTSARRFNITASDENVYWDPASVSLTEDEFQVRLTGSIPTGTKISILISEMDVEFDGPFALFNISQSVSTAIADCQPQNDEESINGFAVAADAPVITEITANCTETSAELNVTANPGSSNGGAIVSYLWEGPGGFTSTDEDPKFQMDGSDPLVQQSLTGTYVVTVTDDKGCSTVGSVHLTVGNNLLPIELLSFTAKASGEEALLEWKTTTEINNSHFDVERSGDARTFTKIGEVKGSGTTSSIVAYNHLDKKPLSGKNYYRLKQVDYDGTSSYTDIKSVTFEANEEIVIYPNPTSGEMRINGINQEWSKVEVYNNLGKLIKETELVGNDKIDISEFSPGLFHIRIKDNNGDEIYNSKIIKI